MKEKFLRNISSHNWNRFVTVEIILGSMTAIASALYWMAYIHQIDWLKEISLSVGSATFSVLITILAINRIDDKRDAFNTKIQTELAFKQLVITLNKHIVLLQLIFKSSGKQSKTSFPQDFDSLFGEKFAIVLGDLDLSTAANIIPNINTTWAEHIEFGISEIRRELGDTLARFGHSLDIKDSRLIADLRNSKIFDYLNQIPALMEFISLSSPGNDFGLRKMIHNEQNLIDYGNSLLALINRINEFLADSQGVKFDSQIWEPQVNPIIVVD